MNAPIGRYWTRESERSLVADFLRTRQFKVEPLSRGSASLVAPAVIPGGGGGGGVAKELLNSGKIRTGVEKVPGVAAPQVVRGGAGHPGRQATLRQELAYRLAGEAAAHP
ncbi:MAG TPA: hypothetical protein VGR26_00225 [Acidimicrobiales bacterium]|nr:hypothetical protein [Acidimicrobiales bacterium]